MKTKKCAKTEKNVPWVPKRLQGEAIEAVTGYLDEHHDRCKVIMACGTGKTLTAMWVVERRDDRSVLVLVPSLSLIAGVIEEWQCHSRGGFDYIIACSDATVIKTSERKLGILVTTDENEIASFLLGAEQGGRPRYVFSTYQSLRKVAEAQAIADHRFDMVICDEAHNCVGESGTLMTVIHDEEAIKADRRVFFTATPKYYTARAKENAEVRGMELHCMDDEAVFGPVAYSLPFATAIREGMICDYQVVIVGVDDHTQMEAFNTGDFAELPDGSVVDPVMLAVQIGIAKAIKAYDLKRLITFHSTVAKAKEFAVGHGRTPSFPSVVAKLSKSARRRGTVEADYLHGMMSAKKRGAILETLNDASAQLCKVVSNCQCLSEGTNVPALDGIAYLDPKSSVVDIIQSVGRVLRLAKGKSRGLPGGSSISKLMGGNKRQSNKARPPFTVAAFNQNRNRRKA